MRILFPIRRIQNTFVVSVLLVAFLVSPFQASAQVSGGANAGSSIGGLGGIALAGVQCFANASDLVSDGLESAGTALGVGVDGVTDGAVSSAVAAATAAAAADATAVPVKDLPTREKVKDIEKQEIKNNTKEYCLDKVVKEAVTLVIDKMTLAIVDYINNGFDGNPFFPTDSPSFFANLAVGEINGFINLFTNICNASAGGSFDFDGSSGSAGADEDCEVSDFGQAVAEALLQNLQRTTYKKFQNSLALVLAHGTPTEFKTNFSVGGWAGYTALFEPQNNPFGSYLLASDEIGRRIEGTSFNRAYDLNKQLDRSLGFFNQQVCSLTATGDPADEYIETDDPRHAPPGTTPTPELLESIGIDPYFTGPLTAEQQEEIDLMQLRSKCVKWRSNSPGYLLADNISDTLGSPLRQLELTDEWQENIALIFDALLNEFINGNGEYGLNGLLGLNPDGQTSDSNVLLAQVNGLHPGEAGNTTPIDDLINGTDPDLDPGIIAIQQDYLIQAQINVDAIENSILHIRALDYCVPGPNPKWYAKAVSNLQTAITETPPSTSGDIDIDEVYYADKIHEITGINLFPSVDVVTFADFADFLIYAFTAYQNAIYADYSPNLAPPSMRPALYNLFNQIDGLVDEAVNYQNQINALSAIMPQLLDIQAQINALLADGIPGNDSPSSPEMQAIADVFADVVSGGSLVSQSQLDALFARMNVYTYQINQADQKLADCLTETYADTSYEPDERVTYPVDLTSHPSFTLLPPTDATYLTDLEFDDSGELDLSGFHGGSMSIPSTDVETFQNFLGVY